MILTLLIIAPAGMPETVKLDTAPVAELSGMARFILAAVPKEREPELGVFNEAIKGCTSPVQIFALAGVIKNAGGGGSMVSVFVDVTGPQLPLPFAVKVSILLPAAISAALGV